MSAETVKRAPAPPPRLRSAGGAGRAAVPLLRDARPRRPLLVLDVLAGDGLAAHAREAGAGDERGVVARYLRAAVPAEGVPQAETPDRGARHAHPARGVVRHHRAGHGERPVEVEEDAVAGVAGYLVGAVYL